MGPWTHSYCLPCYQDAEPDRDPVRFKDIAEERCCACGAWHFSGIFYRADPDALLCKGIHPMPEDMDDAQSEQLGETR